MTYTIDIDTGGTHTDGFFHDGKSWFIVKVDTTPHDLTQGFFRCISLAAERLGLSSESEMYRKTDIIRFSTTVCDNLLLQKRGPKIGLIVTQGFEESLYGAGNKLFDSILDPDLVVGIAEKCAQKSEKSADFDPDEITAKARSLLLLGARNIVICLQHAHLKQQKEKRVKQILDQSYPPHYLGYVPVLLSHQISSNSSDSIRLNTALLNAYFHRELALSLYKAEDSLREKGYNKPLFIVHGDLGVARVARTKAIDTYNSGPAGAFHGAAVLAQTLTEAHVITLDIGGTSTEIGKLLQGKNHLKSEHLINGLVVGRRGLDIDSLAAGGGSIIRIVDDHLTVGPDSASALPGPACFDLGGFDCTVTDVLLVGGYINPDNFLGGVKKLNGEKARESMKSIIQGRRFSIHDLPAKIIDILVKTITSVVKKKIEALDEHQWTLFAYGGCGGLFAAAIAEKAGINRIVTFPFGSVFSAAGSSQLDVVQVYEKPLEREGETGTIDALISTITDLKEKAEIDLKVSGFPLSNVYFTLEIDGKDGVSKEVFDFELTDDPLNLEDSLSSLDINLVETVRVKSTIPVPHHDLVSLGVVPKSVPECRFRRPVYWTEKPTETPVYHFNDLVAGNILHGPAIIEFKNTTIAVPASWRYFVNGAKLGILERE